MAHARKIAVIGLGYVGLPVAVGFARTGASVIGFDIDAGRIADIAAGNDRTREVATEELRAAQAQWTSDPDDLRAADFFIVTVPTPIDEHFHPDLSLLLKASELVGRALKRGDIVVYESTVYPGATEEDCMPALERASGLVGGRDFTLGYSPERINPGDRQHRFETIAKVVAGQDARTLEIVAAVYGSAVKAGVHKAPSIKVAEAAKVIENTQRDLNIAFMNELSELFHVLGIDTGDVLAAARTKWNFLPFTPGLVGGHCIGVDPYYLTHRAQKAGFDPKIILAGRRVNDAVGKKVGARMPAPYQRRRPKTRARDRSRPHLQGRRAGYPQFKSRRYRARIVGVRRRRAVARPDGRSRPCAPRIRHRAGRTRGIAARRCGGAGGRA